MNILATGHYCAKSLGLRLDLLPDGLHVLLRTEHVDHLLDDASHSVPGDPRERHGSAEW